MKRTGESVAVFGDGPLQGAVAFEAFVADAGEHGGEAGDLVHDFGGVLIVPVGTEALGDELDDLPVGLGFAEGFEGFVDALDAALGVGEGAFFFERGRGGKDHVGILRGDGEVDVLNDEEFDFAEGAFDVVGVGVGGDGVFALDVEAVEFAFVDGIDHHAVVEALDGGQRDSPGSFELGSNCLVVDVLVAGKEVGHGAEVAGALNVVVAAEGIGAGAFAHVVAGEEKEIGDGGGGVGPAAVLGDAHGPEDAGAVGLGDFVGDGFDVGGGDAGDALGVLEGEGCERFFIGVEVVDPLVDELQLGEVVVEEVFGDGVNPDRIGGGVGADEEVGALGHLVLAKVGDDEALAVKFVGALDAGGKDGMGLGCVGADDEDEAGLFDVGDGAGVAAILDGARKAHGGGGLAVARTVVDVVGADDAASQLLHEVALFVGALGRGDEGEGVGAVGRF